MSHALHKRTSNTLSTSCAKIIVMTIGILSSVASSFATTKGLSQIVTPDLQGEGDLSLSFQIQDKRIANPYQLQAEMGLTKWAEVAVFQDRKSTRLNSSHSQISYAVFCLKKKN